MYKVVISGTGLFTPPHAVSNEALVVAFNQYVADFNAAHATRIAAGEIVALTESSAEFIEKASGIKQRYLMDAAGVLDSRRMAPSLPERDNDALSVQAEMAVVAAREGTGCPSPSSWVNDWDDEKPIPPASRAARSSAASSSRRSVSGLTRLPRWSAS